MIIDGFFRVTFGTITFEFKDKSNELHIIENKSIVPVSAIITDFKLEDWVNFRNDIVCHLAQ